MDEILKALQAMKDNPEDLSALPNVMSKLEEMKGQEEKYQERINKLQEINRSYLAQIPIPGQEQQQEDQEEEPTLEAAQNYLIETLGGNK